ncbi:MAG TPA: hypothetical protein DEO85_14940 [Maritimibacter sp.]|nr:hypothetical protein [Maritimibacter sp.]
MKTFEIKSPDGKTYEIKAPTMEAAQDIIRRSSQGNGSSEPFEDLAQKALARREALQRAQAEARRIAAEGATNAPAPQEDIQGAYNALKPLVESGRASAQQLKAFEVLSRNGGGFFANPYNGQMTSRELLANTMQPNAAQAFAGGTERGAFYAGNDELAGGISAAVPGPGTMSERARFATERSRAEHEANMRDHPVATTTGEVVGGVATGGRAIDAARQGVGRVAQPVLNLANRNFATRAATSAAIGGADAATYGFMAGEGGNRYDTAIDAGKWGAGLGAAGSLGADTITSYLANRSTRKATDRMVANTPTSDDLRTQAGSIFDEAVRTGETANQAQTAKLAADFRETLTREGLIGPDGKMVTSYPKVSDAFRQIEAYGRQSMSPAQMRTTRRLLQNAAQSNDASEARMGSILLEQFDGFSTQFMPDIPKANDLYTKASRGDMIQEYIDLAAVDAGQYSGSGFENALRTRFRQLARKVVKGDIKGLSPDQVASINRVAEGGSIENFLRNTGKAAPSSALTIAAMGGIPYLVGNSIGGPGLGAALGLGTIGVGAMARNTGTRLQTRNADIAAALMRGAQMPDRRAANPAVKRIVQELLRKNVNASVTH